MASFPRTTRPCWYCRRRDRPFPRREVLGGDPAAEAGLLTFLNLDNLVGEQSVRLPVDLDRCFLARRVNEAEHVSGLFVEPILDVVHVVLPLRREVARVRTLDRLFG